MQTTTAAEYLLKKFDGKLEQLKEAVIRTDMNERVYSMHRGQFQGVEYAKALVEQMVKEAESEDE